MIKRECSRRNYGVRSMPSELSDLAEVKNA